METNAIKHPLPMKLADGNRHIYPTTIDMVFAEDGSTPIFDKQSGDWTANNALNLGGRPAEDYALKDEGGGTGVPAGGSAGQTLVKQSDEDGDAEWENPNLMNAVYSDPEDTAITEEGVVLLIVSDNSEKLGGQTPDYYAKQEKVDQLSQQMGSYLPKTGTAADASKLGGVLASEYAKLTDIPEDNGGDANTLGGKEPKYYLQPRNLLDNSDFTNPVNQRGVTTHTGNGYSIDRWRAYHSDTIHRVTNEGVIVSSNSGVNPNMYQPLENGVIKENQIYTAACCDVNGNVYIWSGIPSSETGGNIVVVYNNGSSNSDVFLFRISVSASGPQNTPLVWAALYEGEYTIDNLPPYIPKGYTSELLECQRYAFVPGSLFRLCPTQVTPNLMDFSITTPVLMRDVPSFTPSTLTLYGMNFDVSMTAISGVSYNIGEVGYAGIVLRATKNSHGFIRGLLDFEGTVFSADL